VLKNRLGLRDQAALDQFEALSVALRSAEPMPPGRFTPTHYRAVHRHFFGDVYAWAGRYRKVRIAKDRSQFCFPENIAAEMDALFAHFRQAGLLRRLDGDATASRAAWFLAQLNAIHPFREGNGRTQLAFLALLAADAGRPLHLERLQPEPFLAAMIASFFGNEGPLTDQIRGLIA
jgi:cell filamentation protein